MAVAEEHVHEKKKHQGLRGVNTTLFTHPITHKTYPIVATHSPNPIVDNILNNLDVTGYVPILNIGQSGTGKSTWSRYLLHMLHQKRNFSIHWFYRDEIQKLDSIIGTLQKGIDHIIVMDDASYALEELSKEDLNNIAKRLTYIRHDVKGKVIIMMNIHYSKAIKKFFRNVPFTFLTSISMEEVNSFQDVFGSYSRYRLRDFANYFQQMMLRKQWSFITSRWDQDMMTFKTNEPFRLGLANEINHLHFFLYTKASCSICDPEFEAKKILGAQDLVDHFVKAYGLDRFRGMARLYSFARYNKKVIDSKRLAIWRSIAEFDKNNQIDWDEVNQILDDGQKKKRKRTYVKKGVVPSTQEALELKAKAIYEKDAQADFREQLVQDLHDLEQRRNLTEPDKSSESFGDKSKINFGSISDADFETSDSQSVSQSDTQSDNQSDTQSDNQY